MQNTKEVVDVQEVANKVLSNEKPKVVKKRKLSEIEKLLEEHKEESKKFEEISDNIVNFQVDLSQHKEFKELFISYFLPKLDEVNLPYHLAPLISKTMKSIEQEKDGNGEFRFLGFQTLKIIEQTIQIPLSFKGVEEAHKMAEFLRLIQKPFQLLGAIEQERKELSTKIVKLENKITELRQAKKEVKTNK